MRELKGKEYIRFESIKHVREDGSEFWSTFNGETLLRLLNVQ